MSRIVSEEEMQRRRQLRKARVKAAEKHNVAIGWLNPDGSLMKQANGQPPPQLPKPPRDAA